MKVYLLRTTKTSANIRIINIYGKIIAEKDTINDEILYTNGSKGIFIILITEHDSQKRLVQKIIKTST